MSSKFVKVSANGRRVIVDSKRKIVTQCRAQLVGANKSSGVRPALNKLGKRKRANECKNKCCSCLRKNVPRNYSNFVKSGLLQRLLYFQDGQWSDFSQEVIDLVKEDFRSKKAAIEVKFNGCNFMLDVLYMILVDLRTGAQKPIGWIDDAGTCVFPESYSSCHGSHDCNMSETQKNLDLGESSMIPEINLHLEINLSGSNNNKLEECVGESNVKRIKLDQEGQRNNCDHSVYDNSNPVEEIQKSDEYASPIFGTVDVETAKNMFITGLSRDLKVDIVDVKKCSGSFMGARQELFQKQVEITQKLRGKANVQYAWLAAAGDASSGILFYGRNGPKLGRYGYGVHLTAVQSAHSSVTICDVDENGQRHLVLCRVILGNMELLQPGSKQFYPSDQCFDSGVDDLQNPNHYVIWNMNMNTHIYPECTVSFKMPLVTKENPVAEESRVDISRVTTHDPNGPLNLDSSSSKTGKNCPNPEALKQPPPPDKVPSVGSSTPKDPKSPWMPFSMLFEAVSSKVDENDMRLLHIFYESFRAKNMNREEFIRKLRSVVGDQILRSTISSLQGKHIPNSASTVDNKKEVQQG